jgi:hypothetical protein
VSDDRVGENKATALVIYSSLPTLEERKENMLQLAKYLLEEWRELMPENFVYPIMTDFENMVNANIERIELFKKVMR